ncbi:MAG: molybdopterin dinucleotide binding domain-containing protein, partial [Bacteroidota bacterium]
ELLQWLDDLPNQAKKENRKARKYPFNLLAGERRAYNANALFRNPEWRKKDVEGMLKIHPEDALEQGLGNGDWVKCISSVGAVIIKVWITDEVPPGLLSMPHGYGFAYPNHDVKTTGALVNQLTALEECDPLAKTPYHKNVRVRLEKINEEEWN